MELAAAVVCIIPGFYLPARVSAAPGPLGPAPPRRGQRVGSRGGARAARALRPAGLRGGGSGREQPRAARHENWPRCASVITITWRLLRGGLGPLGPLGGLKGRRVQGALAASARGSALRHPARLSVTLENETFLP